VISLVEEKLIRPLVVIEGIAVFLVTSILTIVLQIFNITNLVEKLELYSSLLLITLFFGYGVYRLKHRQKKFKMGIAVISH
jgi:hypothetical protein